MKKSVCILLAVFLLFAVLPAASAEEYDGAMRTSRYCSQAPMSRYRALFTPVESFGLNAPLTRAMTAHILYGLLADHGAGAVPEENGLSSAASAWATENGLFPTDAGAPDMAAAISREDLALAIDKALECSLMSLPQINERYGFLDVGLMNYLKQEAAVTLQRGGVMIENGDGLFCPYETVTVAQAESIFLRLAGGMRDLFPELPVATVAQSDPVDDTWFDDACFIGHSQVVGMRDYANLPNIDYFAVVGFKVQDVLNFPYFGGANGRDAPIRNVLQLQPYGKVYIMLGVNDFSNKKDRVDQFMVPMRQLLDIVKETQPDAKIYILSLTPVGRETPMNILYNPENTLFYSQMLKDLSREYGTEYLDVFRILSDSDGYFKEGYSGDGIHMKPKIYPIFVDYLRTHT